MEDDVQTEEKEQKDEAQSLAGELFSAKQSADQCRVDCNAGGRPGDMTQCRCHSQEINSQRSLQVCPR